MADALQIQLSHIGIFATDVERMKEFYCRVLGMTVTDEGDLHGTKLVFLSRDPRDHHQIAIVEGRQPDMGTVINQISFKCSGLGDMKAAWRNLSADPDVHKLDPVDHGNAWSIYFWDPEGNRLEFFMDTPWYVNQPHRIAMDFTLPDAEIYRLSEEHVRSDPSFEPVEDWRAKVAKEMAHA